jgi:glycosyltransferase involved in cell wall biosynthesis
LSAGLPVITNEIGAEGIELSDGENYLFCNSINQYVAAIERLNRDEAFRNKIGNNGKIHIEKYFDVDRNLNHLIDKILELKGLKIYE